jgi:stage V sporulation protein S
MDITPAEVETVVDADDPSEKILRVSASSNVQAVGSVIAHALYDSPQVKMRAVGASAVNQAVKAIAVASGFIAPRGLTISCRPSFTTIKSRDGEISAVVFTVFAS